MPRKLIILTAILALFLTACSDDATAPDIRGATQLAQEMREGSVALNLDLLMVYADRLAPLCEARDADHLLQLAFLAGCTITAPDSDTGAFTILCHDIDTGAERISLAARLQFLENGIPVDDPGRSDTLEVYVESAGDFTLTEGYLECHPDPADGLVIDGFVSTWFPDDGTSVNTSVDRVTGMVVADFGGVDWGVLFTSGSVDLDVTVPGGPSARGTAALYGRTAIVALAVDGVHTQGDVPLGVR